MARHVCIHGHFYQPPRENAWLEAVETQDSAYPYHDWNERITDEGYAPNAAARILDGEGRIVEIVNNYERISFNMGPTLLSWMEKARPRTYRAIIDADRRSRERFGGHGAAIAQVYNHMIMPLANERDKRTQVLWGLADFRHRFGRDPEGMWLPETAADVASLEVLAEHGVGFTILAPRQAARVRALAGGDWRSVEGAQVDPKRPYLCKLPSGREIVLFFYDGPISQELGFGDLLDNGQSFVDRLLGVFSDDDDRGQLVHIATDGETYGHHKRYGDMALAYALHRLDEDEHVKLTVYAEFLAENPPTDEVEIYDNSSWSCVHGVERWRADCGCNSGGLPWHQQWRGPLRAALDWLRDGLAKLFEAEMSSLVDDPWAARDAYIEVVLDRGPESVDAFLRARGAGGADHDQRVRILSLLEMQRHAMLMYTSCGWFFDEISGTETQQVLQYAARAAQLAYAISGNDFETEFITRLAEAPSNLPQFGDGEGVYRQLVQPSRLDLLRVAAHHAVLSVFDGDDDITEIYCYTVENEGIERWRAGRMKLAVGRARIRSRITLRSLNTTFAVLHLGGHVVNGGVREFQGEEAYLATRAALIEAFDRGDIAEIIRLLDDHFGSHNYSLWHLFRDEQRKIFAPLLAGVLDEFEGDGRRIYENHYGVVKSMRDLNIPGPPALLTPIEFVLNRDAQRLFTADMVDAARLEQIVQELKQIDVPLDRERLGLAAARYVNDAVRQLHHHPRDLDRLGNLRDVLTLLGELNVEMRLWEAQNAFYNVVKATRKARQAAGGGGDSEDAGAGWNDLLVEIGGLLAINVR